MLPGFRKECSSGEHYRSVLHTKFPTDTLSWCQASWKSCGKDTQSQMRMQVSSGYKGGYEDNCECHTSIGLTYRNRQETHCETAGDVICKRKTVLRQPHHKQRAGWAVGVASTVQPAFFISGVRLSHCLSSFLVSDGVRPVNVLLRCTVWCAKIEYPNSEAHVCNCRAEPKVAGWK